ncbi:MAG: tetratricopeptide repeat protein [Bacteroidales bacterium]
MMHRTWSIILLLLAPAVLTYGQKSRVLSVIQLIESEKYSEAKESIDLAVWNDRTSEWSRTWYAKGLLCQKAFEAGKEKNDKKLYELYPDQLIVAYDSYEKALDLNAGNRIITAIAKNYYTLANDFQSEGTEHYNAREYAKALEYFEHALLITRSHLVSVKIDTSLVYNTAMSAYRAKSWEKAIGYLTGLNEDSYGPQAALLLYQAYLQHGDSLLAEEVLSEGVNRYHGDDEIVLQLTDLLVSENRMEEAVAVLDSASAMHPDNAVFPWTRGLVLEESDRHAEAITSLKQALELAPEEAGIYYGLGICFYNLGVSDEEKARYISDNRVYRAVMAEARKNFLVAVEYLEQARELDPEHPKVNSRLNLLYQHLQLEQSGQN